VFALQPRFHARPRTTDYRQGSNTHLDAKSAWWARMNRVRPSGAAETISMGPLRHVDPPDLFARAVIDEDLSVCHIHIAFAVHGHALPAAAGKRLQTTE